MSGFSEDLEQSLVSPKPQTLHDPNSSQNEDRTTMYKNLITQFRKIKHQQLKEQGNSKRPPEFQAFFWMNWIQLLLIGLLYWWAAINLDYWTSKDGDKYTLSVVLLRYVPTILMTL